jgi:zinc/manganese transport system substrate-binding protein
MTIRRHLAAGAAVVATVAATGCGSDETPSSAGDRLTIVATTSIWADVTRNIGCGDLADVVTVIPAGGDPHSFEPSLRDRELLGDASLVISNGGGLEPSLQDTIEDVEQNGGAVFRATEHLEMIDDDPHVWMDPTRVAAVLPALADAVAAAGADATAVASCRDAYSDELRAVDSEVEQILSVLTPDRRHLVTSHEALRYFADRYEFSLIGTVIPGGSTLGEANPAELEDLARAIAQTGVRAVFAEEQHSADDIDALAAQVGDVQVVTLFTDALGPEGSGAETYTALLRKDATLIAEGLAR